MCTEEVGNGQYDQIYSQSGVRVEQQDNKRQKWEYEPGKKDETWTCSSTRGVTFVYKIYELNLSSISTVILDLKLKGHVYDIGSFLHDIR